MGCRPPYTWIASRPSTTIAGSRSSRSASGMRASFANTSGSGSGGGTGRSSSQPRGRAVRGILHEERVEDGGTGARRTGDEQGSADLLLAHAGIGAHVGGHLQAPLEDAEQEAARDPTPEHRELRLVLQCRDEHVQRLEEVVVAEVAHVARAGTLRAAGHAEPGASLVEEAVTRERGRRLLGDREHVAAVHRRDPLGTRIRTAGHGENVRQATDGNSVRSMTDDAVVDAPLVQAWSDWCRRLEALGPADPGAGLPRRAGGSGRGPQAPRRAGGVLAHVVGRARRPARAVLPASERLLHPVGRPERGEHVPPRARRPAVALPHPRSDELLPGLHPRDPRRLPAPAEPGDGRRGHRVQRRHPRGRRVRAPARWPAVGRPAPHPPARRGDHVLDPRVLLRLARARARDDDDRVPRRRRTTRAASPPSSSSRSSRRPRTRSRTRCRSGTST